MRNAQTPKVNKGRAASRRLALQSATLEYGHPAPAKSHSLAQCYHRALCYSGLHCTIAAQRQASEWAWKLRAARLEVGFRPRVLVQPAAPTKILAAMSPPLTFNPPITIDLCETAGQEFGNARIGVERVVFERELVTQLAALDEALRAADIDRDQALAAFDTAAWGAWELPEAPEATFQEQSAQ
jgi:hypothetical protein